MAAPASISVVLVTSDTPRELTRCLAALGGQPLLEVVVADASASGVAKHVVREQSIDGVEVRVLHLPGGSLEALREAAVRQCRGDLIAFTEARMTPAPDWVSAHQRAHLTWPSADVIGGPIAWEPGQEALARGLYLCEYAAYAPPARSGPSRSVSAANVSYKRGAVIQGPPPDRWDTVLHHASAESERLRMCDAVVRFQNGYDAASALRMRYRYGRAFAASRPLSPAWRVVYALGSVTLPALLLARLGRAVLRRPSVPLTPASLAWSGGLIVAWSLGEGVGYVWGKGTERMI